MSDKTNTKDSGKPKPQPDVLEKSAQKAGGPGAAGEVTGKLPADFDELPIELVSLTDR